MNLCTILAQRYWICLATALIVATITTPVQSQAPSDKQISIGEERSFHSAILNEDREVLVALPDTYSRTAISYPVLFLLDGSSHMLHASATTRFLANARNRIPDMIVIAIPNTNRNRDMTPGPGAVTFQRVLAEELIPWVERNFRAAPDRILFGHSLSASFAVHTMLNRPELFDAYIAASAPLWRYDNFASEMKAGLPRAAKAGAAVYLTVSLGDGFCRAGDELSARQSYQQAANVAEKLNPSNARISWYRDKAKKGCASQTENRP